MKNNLDIINFAVILIIKAAILATRWSGKARRRSLEKLAAINADAKDKELLFLRDKVHQLQTQVTILQKRFKKNGKKPRYTLRERLLILCHIETYQIPRRTMILTTILHRFASSKTGSQPVILHANPPYSPV